MIFLGYKSSRGHNPSLLATSVDLPPKIGRRAFWTFSSRFQPAAWSRHRQVSR